MQLSNNIIDSIDYKNIKMLSFVGGEPLYEKINFQILQRLIDNNNQNCFISIVTNGSVDLLDRQWEILKQFKNLNFCLSIDGTEKVFEYMRYPLKWNKLNENIEKFRSLGIQLSVSYTISNLNIFYHTQTLNWFKRNSLNHNYNIVINPKYFSIYSLPHQVKIELQKEYPEFFNIPHTHEDDKLFEQMIKNIRWQDHLKGISIKDYLPEVADIIAQYS